MDAVLAGQRMIGQPVGQGRLGRRSSHQYQRGRSSSKSATKYSGTPAVDGLLERGAQRQREIGRQQPPSPSAEGSSPRSQSSSVSDDHAADAPAPAALPPTALRWRCVASRAFAQTGIKKAIVLAQRRGPVLPCADRQQLGTLLRAGRPGTPRPAATRARRADPHRNARRRLRLLPETPSRWRRAIYHPAPAAAKARQQFAAAAPQVWQDRHAGAANARPGAAERFPRRCTAHRAGSGRRAGRPTSRPCAARRRCAPPRAATGPGRRRQPSRARFCSMRRQRAASMSSASSSSRPAPAGGRSCRPAPRRRPAPAGRRPAQQVGGQLRAARPAPRRRRLRNRAVCSTWTARASTSASGPAGVDAMPCAARRARCASSRRAPAVHAQRQRRLRVARLGHRLPAIRIGVRSRCSHHAG